MNTPRLPLLALCCVALAMTGCAHFVRQEPTAEAHLEPTRNNTASGQAWFKAEGSDTVWLHVHMSGLKANSVHGMHLHERGDCSAPDGSSAGGHFNPTGKPHGAPDAQHHAGDIPVLVADSAGEADETVTLHGISIGTHAPDDIIGTALIVHADPDDYHSQPTGNSGARIACAVVIAGKNACLLILATPEPRADFSGPLAQLVRAADS